MRRENKGVELALGAVRVLNRHEADCKLHVSGIGHWKDGRDGRKYALLEFSEKGSQAGKAFWARDGSCCVLKMEKMVEIGD